jgi:hypothetical protein
LKAFKLDAAGDFILENGSFVLLEGDEQLAQEVRMSVQTAKGEYFLDLDEGLDREPLFAKDFDENNGRNSIIESLMNTSEVLAVENISFAKVNRVLLVDISLSKDDGTIINVNEVGI